MEGPNTPSDHSPKPPASSDAETPKAETPGTSAKAETADAVAEKPAAPAEKPQILCRTKARNVIRKYAAFGTVISALPLPPGTSAALAALETHLIYFVGKVYGEDLTHTETMIIASTLNVAGMALRTIAREACGLIPVIGWGVRGAVAGSTIMGIGELAIRHFEMKYPGKTTAV